MLLQCELSSNLATPQWTRNQKQLQEHGMNSGYRIGTDGLLVIEAKPEQSGNYSCFAIENGVRIHVVMYTLIVYLQPLHSTRQPKTVNGSNPVSQSPYSLALSTRNLEAMYISLITILGGLCLVLTVVLLYVGFCVQSKRGKYSLQAAQAEQTKRKRNDRMELKTISSHCNGKANTPDGQLQIVPGEAQLSSNKELPPAPPLPPPLPNSELDYANGFSATLPSVLRKMNGNSYVLLRQSDGDATSPLYYSFTDELNRILEKRKHTQLCSKPDESSV